VDVEDHYAEVKTSRTSKIIERELNTKKAAHQRSVEEYVATLPCIGEWVFTVY
jgi:hypothetical protein